MVATAAAFLASIPLLSSASTQVRGSIGTKSTCYWHVTNQLIEVDKPVLYDVPVEQHCPFEEQGLNHLDVCETCEGLQNECGGEFVACVGCCSSPKKSRFHSCDNIKKYFFEKNSKTLKCDARMDLSDGDVNIEYAEETTQRGDSSGTLHEGCDAPVTAADAEGVPVKLKFDCNNCATQGVPNLLKQCCDKASEFHKSEMVKKFQDEGFTVFLWADGCQLDWIGPAETQIEFKHSYPSLVEDKANKDMDAFVEKQYCTKIVKPESDACPARRLLRQESVAGYGNSSRQLNTDDCAWLRESSADNAPGESSSDNALGEEAASQAHHMSAGSFSVTLLGGALALCV